MTLLAHQLKGPLAVISALAQGLARRGHRMSTDEIRERGKKIWHASRHLDELIATIMNFTRANTGGIVLDRTNLRYQGRASRTFFASTSACPARNAANFTSRRCPMKSTEIAVLIEQALGIVIANAMRYSTEKIVVEGHVLRGEVVSIVVKDAGIGISRDDLPFVEPTVFSRHQCATPPRHRPWFQPGAPHPVLARGRTSDRE